MSIEKMIKECGIFNTNEVFYIECIDIAVNPAIASLIKMNSIIEDPNFANTPKFLIDKEIISLAENIVNQTAILSKYFDPPKKDKTIHKYRGERLKKAYDISENNPLLDRKYRNFIEHFDENLDKFLNDPDKPVAGIVIPICTVFNSEELNDPTFVFKAYVFNERRLIALNKKFDLEPVLKEIFRIRDLNESFNKNGGRF